MSPPLRASRVQLLQAGDTNKNDPDDALSVAVAAPRSKTARPVIAEDYPAVLKVWSRRHRDLARLRNQVLPLHAVLCDLVPGGPVIAGTITGGIADVSRLPVRGHLVACNGTAPVEVSSGNRKIHRLSLRGNRRINHAIHKRYPGKVSVMIRISELLNL